MGSLRKHSEGYSYGKILIVDGSMVQAAQLKAILEDEYDVTVAQRAEEGLRWASDENFSLILLDVVMPGVDGFTLLKKLQEEPTVNTPHGGKRHFQSVLLSRPVECRQW